ncbi:MAG: hypothetical protein IJS37_03850 [Bacilli bacterium]|nr:hypothetical protein [Bacilli bacterium]
MPTDRSFQTDYDEFHEEFPLSEVIYYPSSVLSEDAIIRFYAVDAETVVALGLDKSQLKEERFSKLAYMHVGPNYQKEGTKIYAFSKWSEGDLRQIPKENRHFYDTQKPDEGHLVCAYMEEEVEHMPNVLLFNARTTQAIIRAYQLYLEGVNNSVVLREYSHGDKGRMEYQAEKARESSDPLQPPASIRGKTNG